jgi:hypothetical protein
MRKVHALLIEPAAVSLASSMALLTLAQPAQPAQ